MSTSSPASDLRQLLKSRDTQDRVRAVRTIARADAADRAALLVSALADRSHYVAAMAAEALGLCADEAACVAMVERFAHLAGSGAARDPGCHIRANLAYAFARLDYRPAGEVLRQSVRTVQSEGGVDTGAHLRANSALALAQLRTRDCLRDIALLLFESGDLIEPRKAAAQAIGRLGDPAGIVVLAIKLSRQGRERPEVLEECMRAVAELQDDRALELLGAYLNDGDGALAATAALTLAGMQIDEAAPLIAAAAAHHSGDALNAIALALPVFRSEAGREAMHQLSRSDRAAERLAAIPALAARPAEANVARLTEMAAGDQDARVRSAAQSALPGSQTG